MGMFTGLLTLPLAPLRGVVWIGKTLEREAYRQWTDPAVIRTELEHTNERWLAGEISDTERDRIEDGLLQRLMADRTGVNHG